MFISITRQLEMMNNYPPQLLAALGFPPEALQTEVLKHERLEKLKVCTYHIDQAKCSLKASELILGSYASGD